MSKTVESASVAVVINDITSAGQVAVAVGRHSSKSASLGLHISSAVETKDIAATRESLSPERNESESSAQQVSQSEPLSYEPARGAKTRAEVGLQSKNVAITLVAGAMAGGFAKTVIAPLDRTKIKFQATEQRYSVKEAVKFLIATYKSEGFLSLWRGNSATMARILPYAAIQFTSHEQFKKLLNVDVPNKQTPSWVRFLAGSLAGVTSQTLTYPLDMARARMAVTHKDTYSSLTEVFIKIWKQEGPLTLYRGLTPTILGVIPYAGTSFGIYGTLKYYHKDYTGHEDSNPFEKVLFGAVAGLVGQSSSYPLDIVRRRMQTATVTGNGNTYKTIIGTILKVYRTEGIVHGLYKGLSLNWVKGPLAVGISFATFDHLKSFLEQLSFAR